MNQEEVKKEGGRIIVSRVDYKQKGLQLTLRILIRS